jgi:hypothetical protein
MSKQRQWGVSSLVVELSVPMARFHLDPTTSAIRCLKKLNWYLDNDYDLTLYICKREIELSAYVHVHACIRSWSPIER